MRKTITVSMPENLEVQLRREINLYYFGTTSSFFRHLIRKHFDEKQKQIDNLRLMLAERVASYCCEHCREQPQNFS